jgi:hypothetical protein
VSTRSRRSAPASSSTLGHLTSRKACKHALQSQYYDSINEQFVSTSIVLFPSISLCQVAASSSPKGILRV